MNSGCKKPAGGRLDAATVRLFVDMRLRCAVYGRRYFMGRDALARLLRTEHAWLEEWDRDQRDNKKFRPSPLKEMVGDFLRMQEWWQTTQPQVRERPVVPYVTFGPRQRVQLDLIGPIGTCKSKRFALVVVDVFTRKAWTHLLRDKQSSEVWRKMAKVFKDMFGGKEASSSALTPRQKAARRAVMTREDKTLTLSSDQGTEFMGAFKAGVAKGWGNPRMRLKQSFGTTYRPSSQAHVERLNKTLKTWLFKMQQGSATPRCVLSNLDIVTKQYNEDKEHSAHNLTPEQAEAMSLEEGKAGELRRTIEKKLGEGLAKRAGRKGIPRLPRVEEGDYVRIKVGGKKNHFYVDNWSSVVYRVDEAREPEQLPGYPTQQTRRTFSLVNADTGELLLNKLGAPMIYGMHDLLKVPARPDGEEPGYYAQGPPTDLTEEEMKAICNRCAWQSEEAQRRLVQNNAAPEEEPPLPPTKEQEEEGEEEDTSELERLEARLELMRTDATRAEQKALLLHGLAQVLMYDNSANSPPWPGFRTTLGRKTSADIAEAFVDAVGVFNFDKDYLEFQAKLNTKRSRVKKELVEYLKEGVIAANFHNRVVRDVIPQGQSTVKTAYKKVEQPKEVEIQTEKGKRGYFVYTLSDVDEDGFYNFNTSDGERVGLNGYFAARLALESVMFTPKDGTRLVRRKKRNGRGYEVVKGPASAGHTLPADEEGVREELAEKLSPSEPSSGDGVVVD